jgi:oxygen-independent coproporphyrinogen-3 oxidase
MAVGPGAASFENGFRTMRHRSVMRYLQMVEKGKPVWESDSIPKNQRVAEILCVGLRMVGGVRNDEFLAATGRNLSDFKPELFEEFEGLGLGQRTAIGWKLTPRGLELHDAISEKIMASAGQ